MKNQIRVGIEDFPFTSLVTFTVKDEIMMDLDERLNNLGEDFMLIGYKTEKGITPYYVLNSDSTH